MPMILAGTVFALVLALLVTACYYTHRATRPSPAEARSYGDLDGTRW
ncbi:hypothetical protein ACWDYH_05460 [Nocardia goodfellowii]